VKARQTFAIAIGATCDFTPNCCRKWPIRTEISGEAFEPLARLMADEPAAAGLIIDGAVGVLVADVAFQQSIASSRI
jgi:hypothetical protein